MRKFVRKWTVALDQDCTVDRRGWEKGRLRNYQPQTADVVVRIKTALLHADRYFYGAQEVGRVYRQRYPAAESLSIDFIKRVCRQHGLTRLVDKRHRDGSVYQHYPAYTIAHLAESITELDFIGEKNITGHMEPVNVIAYNALQPFRFREYAVVAAQTS